MTQSNITFVTCPGTNNFNRIYIPYCLEPLQPNHTPPRYVYLPLNRNYKPLGISSRTWVDYNQYRAYAINFSTDPKTFKGVYWGTAGDTLYLYDDGKKSRKDYYQRLNKLFSYKKYTIKKG